MPHTFLLLSFTAAFTIVLCCSDTTIINASTTNASTTNASTTNASTTNASTTNASTTNASTTNASTTNASTTNASTTTTNQTTHAAQNNLEPNFDLLSVGPMEVSKGGFIWLDLPTQNGAPGNPGNWTYQLESTPYNGTVPIKKGELIPDGKVLYKAFPGGDDYFTYKVTYKVHNETSSAIGSVLIKSYIPKPIIPDPVQRLIASFVIAIAVIIAVTIAAWRIISKLRKNKNPINSSKFWDILRTSDMDPSLSVFQFFLWTIVLMFVLLTVYLIRAFGGVTEVIPGNPPLNLLALTGISIVTPLGSSLISSLGYPKTDTVIAATSEDGENIRPSWGEMLREFGKPTLSRYQMFGWTWISILIYLSIYGAEISNHYTNVGILSLNIPDVYAVLVALMGLSQVVFLGAKANVTNEIEITKVFPLKLARGEQASIFGLNFGNDRQDVWLGTHRIGSADKDLLGWSDGRIDIRIPDIPDPVLEDGYEVMVAKGGSSKVAFKGDSPIRIKIL